MIDVDEGLSQHQQFAPVNLDAIAMDLAIPIRRERLPADVSGKITRDRNALSGFFITINSTQHPKRQRFTLAHELAHYIMHRDLIEAGVVDDTMYRSGLSNRYEVQANNRAAEIIMPTRLVRREAEKLGDLRSLAEMFDVSEEAMRIRLNTLGMNVNEADLEAAPPSLFP